MTALLLLLAILPPDQASATSGKTTPAIGGSSASPDSSRTLRGGQDGTVFQSLTIEGEDRIRIEFDRPELTFDLDPGEARGLEWSDLPEILNRDAVDLVPPLLRDSAARRSPFLARPWLSVYKSGAVVQFRPSVQNVASWRLSVADSRGRTVAAFEGKGAPPREIAWNGLAPDGTPAHPGLTYSHLFEASDRAGNKRNFVGEGFALPPYRSDIGGMLWLLFPGEALRAASPDGSVPILLESADCINQLGRPQAKIRAQVTARGFEQAREMSEIVVAALKRHVIGDPLRIQAVTDVHPDAAAAGTVAIAVEP